MEIYKEINISPFSNVGIFILLLLPLLTYYAVNHVNQQSAIVSALIATVIVIVPLAASYFTYKKAIFTYRNDTLNIKFIKQCSTKEYSINLLTISEYKEVYYRGSRYDNGKLIFIDNDLPIVEIPYYFAYKDVKNEILRVLQNYNIKVTTQYKPF